MKSFISHCISYSECTSVHASVEIQSNNYKSNNSWALYGFTCFEHKGDVT